MSQFEILIRGQSSYAVMAQLIGNFKLIIEPFSFHWEDEKLIMDDVMVAIPNYMEKKVSYFNFNTSNTDQKKLLTLFWGEAFAGNNA